LTIRDNKWSTTTGIFFVASHDPALQQRREA
jgi:hypothetical protein